MATKFYFSSSGTPYVTPTGWSNWKLTGVLGPFPLITGGVNTLYASGTNSTVTATTIDFIAIGKWVSPALSAQTISGTLRGVIRCRENNAGLNATVCVASYIAKSDGTTRGILVTGSASDNTASSPPEMSTASRTRQFQNISENVSISLNSVSVQDTDSLVVEIGYRESNTTSSRNATIFYGNPNGIADHVFSSGVSTPLTPWIEFSNNILFKTSPVISQKDYVFPIIGGLRKNITLPSVDTYFFQIGTTDYNQQISNSRSNQIVGFDVNDQLLELSPPEPPEELVLYDLSVGFLPIILESLEHFRFPAYPTTPILQKDFTFPIQINLRTNTIGLKNRIFIDNFDFSKNISSNNNKSFNFQENLLKNKTGLIGSRVNIDIEQVLNSIDLKNKLFTTNFNFSENISALANKNFNIQYDLNKNNIAQLSKIYSIDFDLLKNTIGLIGSEFSLDFDLSKSTSVPKNLFFNIDINILKNIISLSNKIFNINYNLIKNLVGLKNTSFDENLSLNDNNISLNNKFLIINVMPQKQIVSLINPKFLLDYDLNLNSNRQKNSVFLFNTSLFSNKNALNNSIFEVDFFLRKNIIGLIGPDFNLLFGLSQSSMAEKEFSFLYPISYYLIKNTVVSINPKFNIDYDLNTNKSSLNNAIYLVSTSLFKNMIALLNPSLGIGLGAGQDTDAPTSSIDIFAVTFNLIKNIQVLKNLTYNTSATPSKNIVGVINPRFNEIFNVQDNLIGLSNKEFNLGIEIIKNLQASLNKIYSINYSLTPQNIANKNRLFNIDFDISKNNLGLIGKQFISDFDFSKNNQVNKSGIFNINISLNKNTISNINPYFNFDNNLILQNSDALSRIFDIRYNFSKNTIAVINPEFGLNFGAGQTVSGEQDVDSFFTTTFNLIKNIIVIKNSAFLIDTDLNKNIISQNNKIFDVGHDLNKNINAVINPYYSLDILDNFNTQSLKNRLFTLNFTPQKQTSVLSNKNFNILYNVTKNTIALINPDFDFGVSGSQDKAVGPVSVGANFIVGFSLLKHINVIKNAVYNLDIDLNKNLIAAINSEFIDNLVADDQIIVLSNKKFNINLNINKNVQGIINPSFEIINFDLTKNNIGLGNKIYELDLGLSKNTLSKVDTNLIIDLNLFKNLTADINSEFGIQFRLTEETFRRLSKEYTFPLVIDLGYDIDHIAAPVIIELFDGVDTDFWCSIKKVNLSILPGGIKLYTIPDDIVKYIRHKDIGDNILSKNIDTFIRSK